MERENDIETLVSAAREHASRLRWLGYPEQIVEAAAIERAAARLAADHQRAVDLLLTFVDDEPCALDHHGHCQTHGWLIETECHVARARRLIAGALTTH